MQAVQDNRPIPSLGKETRHKGVVGLLEMQELRKGVDH